MRSGRAAAKVGRVEEAGILDAARLARDCVVMTRAVALGRWISTAGPRPVTPRRVLRKPDLPAAAAVIGVPLPARLRTAADVPAIHRPWCLALAAGLLRVEDGAVSAGPALARWPPADAEVLSAWLSGLTACSAAEAGLDPHEQDEAAGDVLVLLRVLQDEHVPAGQALVHAVRVRARDLYDEFGLDASFGWRADEGPVTRAAARLASFGAVSGNDMLTGGCVITPLGRWAAGRLRTMLAGPGEDLSAAELIAYLAECAEDDRFEHAWDWLDAQPGPADAARRLLVAGASMEPRLRWIAAYAVELLGEDALPVWRDMVQVPGIGPHARFALYEMEAGPEPSDAEWLWLAVESAARALAENGPDEAITVLWDCLPAQQLAADDLDHRVAMARASDHPSARSLARTITDHVASAGLGSLSVHQCLQLKVTLKHWRPPIWRTVLMPATATLPAPAPGDPDPVWMGRRPPPRVPGTARDVQRPVLQTGRGRRRDPGARAGRPRRRRREVRLRVRFRRGLDARGRPAEEAAARSRRRLSGVHEVQRRLSRRVSGRGDLVLRRRR